MEHSYANHTGNMVRVSVAAAADPETVAKQVVKVLATDNRNPTRLTDDEFKQALDKEQWRESARVGELSAIEFRTLGLRQVRAFAEKQKLDKDTSDKLVKIAEQEWDRLVKESAPEDPKQPGKIDWTARCRQFVTAVVDRAKPVLTEEQLERFKESFSRLSGDERPTRRKK